MTETTALLTPKPLYVEVAELVRQQIYSRELEPGSWIDEMKMVENLASAAPLARSAESVGRRRAGDHETPTRCLCDGGFRKDLHDVYHLLSLLESDAAAVVAEKSQR